jgi:Xaa-Pro aminopeptidase
MPEIHEVRRERARDLVRKADVDAALITSGPNVRYLTGLASSNAAVLLPAEGPAVLATDSRYEGAARRDAPDLELIVERYIEPRLARELSGRGYRAAAFEAHEMTVERLTELSAAAAGAQLTSFGRKIEELRTVKDLSEVALLATACRISDLALADLLPELRPGRTERWVAAALDHRMAGLGADGPAFETIVASGPNGAIPHHKPTDRPIRRGDLVTIDFGASYAGYNADMTRTIAVGEPAAWQRDIYELVAAAQRAGIEALEPGADVRDVDAAARDLIDAAGYGANFQHGLGHGVGLEVHEAPILGYGRTGKLSAGVPVTVEPGVYLPGKGGVRIEDILVVGSGTGTRMLTTTTRELLVLLRSACLEGLTWPPRTILRMA